VHRCNGGESTYETCDLFIHVDLHQDAGQASKCERVERLVERVTVSRQAIEIRLAKPNVATTNPLVVPLSPQAFRRKRDVIQPTDSTGTRPIRAESRNRLLNGIAKARH
jgi:hypothetical protein